MRLGLIFTRTTKASRYNVESGLAAGRHVLIQFDTKVEY